MDRDDPDAAFKGRVFIDNSGSVERVSPAGTPDPPGYVDARRVDVGEALVLPGLIDLHNHIGYNALPLWAEKKRKEPWLHHDSWPDADSYQGSISWPAKALVEAAPEALLAYVQLRALVGGTTGIQGWPGANRKSVQVLRDVDDETAGGTDDNLIRTSTLTLSPLELGKRAQAQKQGAGFIYHCAEGRLNSKVTAEFVDADNAGCLGKTFIGIHCNAIPPAEWKRWPKNKAGTVVWSPFSNLWLYGTTTDVPAARGQGVGVCLGSDWGPSGTKNVQGEMKVARLASDKLGYALSDRELVAMVTTNPGDALSRCWKKTVGRLVPDAFGDVTILRPGGGSVWARIVGSVEDDVMLVVYDGLARYGDSDLMTAAATGPTSAITLKGRQRRFAIADPQRPGDAWKWKDITGTLDRVRKDPVTALAEADGRRRSFAGPMDAPDAPLELVLDMPFGGAPMAGDIRDHAEEIEIPPLPSLLHDAAFFKSIEGRGFHGGLLDGLKEFYR